MKEQIIDRYREITAAAIDSRDPGKMQILEQAQRCMFETLAAARPELAEKWLQLIEPVRWENFLSDREAVNVNKRTINQDGSRNFRWPYETFVKIVRDLSLPVEDPPAYNQYALWTVMNTVYSDHARSIAEDMGYHAPAEVPTEKMALSCYRKAVEMLADPDRGFDVRKYFRGKMCDDSPGME